MPSKSKRSKTRSNDMITASTDEHTSAPERPVSMSPDATAATAAPPAETDKSRKRKGKRKRSSIGPRSDGPKDSKRKRTDVEQHEAADSLAVPLISGQHRHGHNSASSCPPVSPLSSSKPDQTTALKARIAELEAQVGAYAEVAACETNMIGGIQEDLTCGICCSPLWRPHTLVPCGHVFCLGCLVAWFVQRRPSDGDMLGSLLHQHKHCPRCRTKLTHAPVESWIHKSINERLNSGGTRLRQLRISHSVQLDRLPELGDGVGAHTIVNDPSEAARVFTEAERDAQSGLTDRLRAAQTRSQGKAVGVFYDIFRDTDGTSKLSWDSSDDIWRCQLCHSEVAYWTCQNCGHQFTHDDLPEELPVAGTYELEEWGDEGLSGSSYAVRPPPITRPPDMAHITPYQAQLARADWRIMNLLALWQGSGRLNRMDPDLPHLMDELVRLRMSAYASHNSQACMRSLVEKLDTLELLNGQLPNSSGVFPGPFYDTTPNDHARGGFVQSLLGHEPPLDIEDGPESLPSSPEQASDADSNGNLAGFVDSDDGVSQDRSYGGSVSTSEEDLSDNAMSASARGNTPRPSVQGDSDGDIAVPSDEDEGHRLRIGLSGSPSSDQVSQSRHSRTSRPTPSMRGGRAGRTRSRAQVLDSDDDE